MKSKVLITLFILVFCFAIDTIDTNVHAQSRTVSDLLNKISKKRVKKRQTAVPTLQDPKPKRIKRSQLRRVAPTKRSSTSFLGQSGDEAQLGKLLDEEIKQLFKLMQRYQKSNDRGEIWLRLAERYIEKSKLLEINIQRKFDKRLQKWENTGRQSNPPRLNLKPVYVFNRKAIELYRLFLKNFPKDSKIDQALFFLGWNYFNLNQADEGVKYYNRLIVEHKRSPYVKEVYFELGDYYFEKKNWNRAKKEFLKVARKKPKDRFYHLAIYKLAWCEYNLGNGPKGIRYLERVLTETKKLSASNNLNNKGISHIHLAREATRDLIVFYSKVKNYKGAKAYFRRFFNRETVSKHLEELAYIYADDKNHQAARHVFKILIQENSTSPKAFEYQREIVSVYHGLESPIFKSELFDWVSKYSKKSRWATANRENTDVLQKAENTREDTLRRYILGIHQTAQKSNALRSKKEAMEGYNIYLNYFANHKEAIEMRFYFAELLYDLKRFPQASVQYLKVADAKSKNKYSNEALMNAFLALDQGLKQNKKRINKNTKRVPYPPAEKQFLATAQKYLPRLKQTNPDKVANIAFKIAHIMYTHNHFDQALKSFWDIIKVYPNTEFTESSAHLILDIYNLKKDYVGLITAGTRLIQSPSLNPKMKAEIKAIVEGSQFQIAQNLEKQKKYKDSAKAYGAFADKNRKSKLYALAIFNAAINYERGNDILRAIKYHRQVVNTKNAVSKRDHHQKSRRILATLYEKTGQLKKAAFHFEAYAKAYPNDQYTNESYHNAAIIFRGFKQYDKAVQNFNSYYHASQNSKADRSKRLSALISIAEIHEQTNRKKRAYAYYERYIRENPSDPAETILAHVRLARIAADLKWKKRASEWYTKTVAVQKAYSNIGKSEAAEAKFYLLQETYTEFRSLRIPVNQARQAGVINKKLALLKTLSAKLAEVVAYDDPNYVIRSVTLIGEANEHFAQAVMTAPLPPGLNKAQEEEYRKAVDQKLAALPRRTAIENYKLAIHKAFELKAYNKALKKAFKRLSVMQPNSYKEMKDIPIRTVKLDLYRLNSDPIEENNDEEEEEDIEEGANVKARKVRSKYTQLASAIQNGNEQESQVIRAATKILAKNPQDGVVLNGLAVFYLRTKRPGIAKIYLGKALKSDIPKSVLQNNRAVASLMEGETKVAVDDLIQVIKEKISGPAAANLGYILLDHQDMVNATRYLRVAAKAFPEDPAILNNYAIVLKYRGEFDQSKSLYKRSLEKDSSHPHIQLNYGRLLVEKFKGDNKREAIELLNKVKFIGSDVTTINAAEDLLKEVQ